MASSEELASLFFANFPAELVKSHVFNHSASTLQTEGRKSDLSSETNAWKPFEDIEEEERFILIELRRNRLLASTREYSTQPYHTGTAADVQCACVSDVYDFSVYL